MILLIFTLFLPFSSQADYFSADYFNDHLTNNVDVTIDPCDNFYLHVCSQSVNATEFPFSKIWNVYDGISTRFHNISKSRNLPIINDIETFLHTKYMDRPVFNRSVFKDLVRARCEDNYECYQNEFKFFFEIFDFTMNKPLHRLEYFKSKLDSTNPEDILKIITRMVEATYDTVNIKIHTTGMEGHPIHFYDALTNRLFVMEKLKEDGIFDKIPDIKEDIEQFKALIVEKLRNTPWLNKKYELGLTTLTEFEDTINDIFVYYDLDESDRDLELLRAINSKFAENYYKEKERSTGIKILDTFCSTMSAYLACLDNVDSEEYMLVKRVGYEMDKNAFYEPIYTRYSA